MKIKVWSLVALAPFASAALHPLSAAQIACLEMTEKAVHSAKKDDPIFIKYFGYVYTGYVICSSASTVY